jgi:hypothetical protein
MSEPLTDIRMVASDWYDGPTGGILIDSRSGRVFRFHLLDWDSGHRIRLFALQEVSPSVVDRLLALTPENPTWPVWYPKILIRPTEEALEWAESVNRSRIRPGHVDSILVWDSTDDRALGMRGVEREHQAGTVPWFDAVESPGGVLDWFELLSVPRQ